MNIYLLLTFIFIYLISKCKGNGDDEPMDSSQWYNQNQEENPFIDGKPFLIF
jgi:hypothetical protein